MVCNRSTTMTGQEKLSESEKRFKTKREATDQEHHFCMKEANDLGMIFGEFV